MCYKHLCYKYLISAYDNIASAFQLLFGSMSDTGNKIVQFDWLWVFVLASFETWKLIYVIEFNLQYPTFKRNQQLI